MSDDLTREQLEAMYGDDVKQWDAVTARYRAECLAEVEHFAQGRAGRYVPPSERRVEIDLRGVQSKAEAQLAREFAIRRYRNEYGVTYSEAQAATDEHLVRVFSEVLRPLGDALRQLARAMAEAAAQVGESWAAAFAAHPELVSPPAESPRERALRLRQQRNTGPAPVRLDGRRAR